MKELPTSLAAMSAYRQFILYLVQRSSARPGKADKFPCDYQTGKIVNAHDSAFWTDAATAIAAAEKWGSDYGVGFVFSEDDPFWFLDLDDCLLPDDKDWNSIAKTFCNIFAGAAVEVSQSGRGLHIFGSGKPPPHSCKNVDLHIEFYHTGRFVALTGRSCLGDCATDFSQHLSSFVEQYFPPRRKPNSKSYWTIEAVSQWRGPINDEELIQRARNSRSAGSEFGNRASFEDLWTNNLQALSVCYPADGRDYDASSADYALAYHLAYWTGKDCARIHRIMLKSALNRDKWERPDYLRLTIMNAVTQQTSVLMDAIGQTNALALQGVDVSLRQLGTQDAVAQIFVRRVAGKMLYNHTRGIWLEWDGTRWRPEITGKAFNFARDTARTVNHEAKSSLGSANFCTGVEKFAKADPELSSEGTEFDTDNYLLNTPDGTYSLRDNIMQPHDPNDRITLRTSVSPKSSGGKIFHKFLNDITLGNYEFQDFLQISLGACLSGAKESHWMLFWIGQGRNGKNTLGDLIQEAMGSYARKIPSSTLMAKRHEGHLTEIANLLGVRLAISSEINDGEYWNEARINEVTGDTTLSARFMSRDHFEFTRTHKHLIYGNHRPQLRSISVGIKSRIKIIPFKASFAGREDPDLPKKLRQNLGYVLFWLIEGHKKWLESGKTLPQCHVVEAESADYFASQSTVEMWIEERVTVVSNDERPASHCPQANELYQDYVNWKKNRCETPVAQSRWGETMRKHFNTQNSNGVRYLGIALAVPFKNVQTTS